MSRRRALLIALTALPVLIGSVLQASPVTAVTNTARYASPTGSGMACTTGSPCGIEEAFNHAHPGDEVILKSGTYGSAAAPLAQLGRSALTLNVHPADPARPPVIYTGSADTIGIVLPAGSHLAHVTVIDSNTSSSVMVSGTADHIAVFGSQAENGVCRITGTLSDSLCVAAGENSPAVSIFSQTSDAALTLRNVTALGTDPGDPGLLAPQTSAWNTTVQVANSIIKGDGHDIQAVQFGTGSVSVTTSHSDYDPTTNFTQGSATITSRVGDVVKPPVFANGKNPYAESRTSPTLNHGAPVPAGDTDLAGLPRTLGSAPDIGAFEFAQPPTAAGLAVTKRTSKSLRVALKVNSEGLSTTVTVTAHRRHHRSVTVIKKGLSTNKPILVHLKLRGLKKGTTYHLQGVAKNGAGHASTKTVTAKTKR